MRKNVAGMQSFYSTSNIVFWSSIRSSARRSYVTNVNHMGMYKSARTIVDANTFAFVFDSRHFNSAALIFAREEIFSTRWSWPHLPVAPFRAFLQTRPRPPGVPFPVVPPFLRPILRSPHLAHLSYWFKLRHPRLVPSFRRSYQPIILILLPESVYSGSVISIYWIIENN